MTTEIDTASSILLNANRTDTGNAEVFAHLWGTVSRYDHGRDRWLLWRASQHRWAPDDTKEITRRAINTTRKRAYAAVDAGDSALVKFAVASENNIRLRGMLAVATSHSTITDNGDGWDTNPDLLGCPNGVVDLRTGTLRDGRPSDRITMQTAVPYDPTALAPTWEKVLGEVFPDAPTAAYFGRAAGASLTGHVRDDRLFFPFGPGENGKTTIEEALLDVAGDYGHALGAQALLQHRAGAHTTEMADLEGKRYVVIGEVPMEQLNEARIKHLTGGGRVTARRMRSDTRTFPATHTLWMDANEFPSVSDQTHGFWRRIDVLPMPYTFAARRPDGAWDVPPNIDPAMCRERDEKMNDTLRGEGPGILAWWVARAGEYLRDGLGERPDAVRLASKDFKDGSDVLAEFLETCAVADPDAFTSVEEARKAYRAWCREGGIADRDQLRDRQLARALGAKFRAGRNTAGNKRGYRGVLIMSPDAVLWTPDASDADTSVSPRSA